MEEEKQMMNVVTDAVQKKDVFRYFLVIKTYFDKHNGFFEEYKVSLLRVFHIKVMTFHIFP